MERVISASEAIQRFLELLRAVSEGNSFAAMSRDRAVARVLPVDRTQEPRSIGKLLNYVANLLVRHSGDWVRDDLYE